MEASYDVITFYIVFIFFSLFTAILMMGSIVGFILAVKRKAFSIFALSILVLLLASVSLLLNPFLNYWIFMGTNYRALRSMRRDIQMTRVEGISTQELVARFGNPKRVREVDGTERWVYEPGPWYSYMQLDYIVFKVENGKVLSHYVDYF